MDFCVFAKFECTRVSEVHSFKDSYGISWKYVECDFISNDICHTNHPLVDCNFARNVRVMEDPDGYLKKIEVGKIYTLRIEYNSIENSIYNNRDVLCEVWED